jgi:hypothetical protein
MHPQVVLDRGDQFVDAAEHTAADPLVGQLAEPPLRQVQPRAGGRGEVQVETGMLGQPGFDLGFAVGLSPRASQIRCTVAGLIPTSRAIERTLQWVAPAGR